MNEWIWLINFSNLMNEWKIRKEKVWIGINLFPN